MVGQGPARELGHVTDFEQVEVVLARSSKGRFPAIVLSIELATY